MKIKTSTKEEMLKKAKEAGATLLPKDHRWRREGPTIMFVNSAGKKKNKQ